MVNVIICDDNVKDRNNIELMTKTYLTKNKIEYKIHSYSDYNKEFNKVIESKMPFKIYLLDIETPSRSGIDVARQIRKNDVDSVIVFLTCHEELGSVVLKNDIMFLSFINKFDDCCNRLKICLDKAMKILNKKQILRFNDRNTIYTIKLDDIIYITKESYERKTVLKTDYTEFKVNKSLNEISKLLDERFIQTHRSCVINKNRTSKIDKQNKLITFDTGEIIDLISDKYKKELVYD